MGNLENTMKGQGEILGKTSFKYQEEKLIIILNLVQSLLHL